MHDSYTDRQTNLPRRLSQSSAFTGLLIKDRPYAAMENCGRSYGLGHANHEVAAQAKRNAERRNARTRLVVRSGR